MEVKIGGAGASSSANPSVGQTGTPAANQATEIAGVDGSGNLRAVSTDAAGNQNVNIVSTTDINGTLTLSSGSRSAAIPVSAISEGAMAVSGTWVATSIIPYGSVDGTVWNPLVTYVGGVFGLTGPTANGTYKINSAAAFKFISFMFNGYTSGSAAITYNFTIGSVATAVYQTAATNLNATVVQGAPGASAWKVDGSAVTQPVSSTSLNSIDTKTPALGQAAAASSVPVVLPTAQISALTPLTSVTVTQTTGTNLHTVVDSGSVALSAGTANIGHVDGLGTAGTPTGGVVSIQGVSGGTALSVTSPGIPTTLGQTTMSGSQPVVIASDQSVIPISQPDLVVTGQAAQTALVNNILTTTAGSAATPTAGYRSASVQIVSTATAGAFTFEGSNDNVNFQTIPVFSQGATVTGLLGLAISASASQIIYTFPVSFNYIRLRISTALTGGSAQAFLRLSQQAWAPTLTNAYITAGIITTVAAVTSANLGVPGLIADVASAAITTTTTTAALTPTFGTSYQLNIPITAVSGTSPTLQIQIQESSDTGVNWYPVWDSPVYTAVGSYSSPNIKLRGNRVRYVQTVGGTTPSFTRAINRLQASTNGDRVLGNPSFNSLWSASPLTSVNTSTYTTIIASSMYSITRFRMDDTGGQALIVATGVSGSELTIGCMPPGGNSQFDCAIPPGTRISVKLADTGATVPTSGSLYMSFWG